MKKNIGSGVAAVIALVVAWSPVVRGANPPAALAGRTDWNQWRGPNRNGIAPDSPKLADAWGPDGPVLLWKSEEDIPGGNKDGKGWSNYGSPVVAKNKVYLFVHNQSAAADVVVCLDANTGKTLWKTSFPGFPQGCYSSTPYVGDGKVYAVGSKGMYCLDAETGRVIWKTPCLGNNVSSSPALVAGVLVVSTGIGKPGEERVLDGKGKGTGDRGLFKGFDAATGKELWACPLASAGMSTGKDQGNIDSSAGVWVTDKGPRIITNTGKLTCLNPKDGAVIWQGDEAACCVGSPTIVGDTCIIANKVAGYRLRPGKVEKLFDTDQYDRGASQLLDNGHVYATCAGMLQCYDLTGKLLWQKTFGGKISSPVIADGKLFWVCADKGDKMLMTSATPSMPEKFFVASVPVLEFTTPAICGGKMFLRRKDGVACYDLTKPPAAGAITSKDPTPFSAPATKALIAFVDVSPSYPWQKNIQLEAWPPEIKEKAAAVDWAMNKALSADGKIDFIEVQDERKQETRNAVVYARAVLDAAAPGKLALSLSVSNGDPGRPDRLSVFVNGANVLRQDIHDPNTPHVELVVNLVAGKNTLLFRVSQSNDDWGLQVQAKALGGLMVKQVAPTSVGTTNTRRTKP